MRNGRMMAALAAATVVGAVGPLAAQSAPPGKVTVQATGAGVTVAWAPPLGKGLTYRVLRAPDPKTAGVDITKPVATVSVVDPNVVPGATYFYQVIALYGDGTSAAAAPVQFTMPGAPVSPVVPVKLAVGAPGGAAVPVGGQTILKDPNAIASRLAPPPAPPAPPPAVTGIKVSGTLASATVEWLPVSGASSYTVTRTPPAGQAQAYPGLTATTWTDNGPANMGFTMGGVYNYDVAALLPNGASATGHASWTRPAPTCASPPPSQTMLTVLGPTIQVAGPYPDAAVFTWGRVVGAVAYLVERSPAGTNAWTLAATSCGSPFPLLSGEGTSQALQTAVFIDHLGGVAAGNSYSYRVTALAATGDAGASTVAWTAPVKVPPRWLGAAVSGNTVTVRWRYEPPATNAPSTPFYRVTSDYGLDQRPSGVSAVSCAVLAGCSWVITAVPSGSHRFSMIAQWTFHGGGSTAIVISSASADTSLTIP